MEEEYRTYQEVVDELEQDLALTHCINVNILKGVEGQRAQTFKLAKEMVAVLASADEESKRQVEGDKFLLMIRPKIVGRR